jgi:hypothetical protein
MVTPDGIHRTSVPLNGRGRKRRLKMGVAKHWVKRIEKHEPSSQESAVCATDVG